MRWLDRYWALAWRSSAAVIGPAFRLAEGEVEVLGDVSISIDAKSEETSSDSTDFPS